MSDINQEVLAEIRKLRRLQFWSSILALLVLVAFVAFFVSRMPKPPASVWSEVSNAMRRSDYTKALGLAQVLEAKHPDDYYAHWYLGNIYLAIGDPAHAEAEYSRAYELLPSEDLEKRLRAVQKRRASNTVPQASPAATP